jgi:hypothetical protein
MTAWLLTPSVAHHDRSLVDITEQQPYHSPGGRKRHCLKSAERHANVGPVEIEFIPMTQTGLCP